MTMCDNGGQMTLYFCLVLGESWGITIKTSVALRFVLFRCFGFNVYDLASYSWETQTASGSFWRLKRHRHALIKTHSLQISRVLCIRAVSRGCTSWTPFSSPLWDLTIPRCCQNSFLWNAVVVPSHNPAGLQIPTEAGEAITICTAAGSPSHNETHLSPPRCECKMRPSTISPSALFWVPHSGMLVQNIMRILGSVVKHQGNSCPSGFRQ